MTDATSTMADLAEFVRESPVSYQTAQTLRRRLEQAGFVELDETKVWSDVHGAQFIVRDGAVMAWIVPDEVDETTAFRIVGSHTDSPTFKLKTNPSVTTAGWQQVAMEIYGGPLLNSWLDRELGLAGRLTTLDGEVHPVRTGSILRIPQLAVHLDRGVNEGLALDRQQHTMPIAATGDPDFDILEYLCELAGIERNDLAHHDVMAFPTEAPQVFGTNGDFFASSRLDNLSSVYASLEAITTTELGPDIAVLAAFDHEELGSATRSGAAGPILQDVLTRIASGLGITGDGLAAMFARSSVISADAGHAVHPNYVGKHDPQNQPHLNEGPLLKINANQRYATDAIGGALWMRCCQVADVPTQPFISNNASPTGSTIGPITATRLGITTVDVGIPLLSMHSAREMCGVLDPGYLTQALSAYWAGA